MTTTTTRPQQPVDARKSHLDELLHTEALNQLLVKHPRLRSTRTAALAEALVDGAVSGV